VLALVEGCQRACALLNGREAVMIDALRAVSGAKRAAARSFAL
jgi:hypothetical protein